MSSKKLRTILVGDIHGCYRELKALLNKINFDRENDRLISLGDLVHKGPKSWKVLEFFFENKFEVIKGNHDEHFLNFLKGDRKPYAEGEKILSKVNIPKERLIEWMESFPYYIQEKDFIAVHAAFDSEKKYFYETSKSNMISARYQNTKTGEMIVNAKDTSLKEKPWYHIYPPEKVNNKTIVFGHWAQPLARFYKNFRCIDTGCCYGGHLSCLILPEDRLVKVQSEQSKKFNY